MSERTYRFRCMVETPDGEVLIEDYCTIGHINEFGACEAVDIHVGALLRAFNRTVRAEHEAANETAEA